MLSGYQLPFVHMPDPVFRYNHATTWGEEEFVNMEIGRLLETSCIIVIQECPKVCSPLLVVCNEKGKERLVLDLRDLNGYLPKQKFKYEGLSLIPDMCAGGDYFITFDLKSGYHHVDIHPHCWQYLGFSWVVNAVRRFYMFTVLPFGLSTACYVFTKLLRPLVKRWRSLGLRAILYIDDGICVASTVEACKQARDVILADLKQAGLVINVPKSQLLPQQVGVWLGVVINLKDGMFVVPSEKIVKLQQAIGKVPLHGLVPVRLLASIVGQIIAMSLAIGPIARLRIRYVYDVINHRHGWHARVSLTEGAREEMLFWKD